MTHLWQDLRVALRGMRSAPLATTVTVISLGLGIGAVTTVFTLANTLLLSPPTSWTGVDELVAVYTSRDDGKRFGRVSFPDYEDLRDSRGPLAGVAAYTRGVVNLGRGAGSRVLLIEGVSGNFFDVLGGGAVLGRTFTPEEAAPGGERVVVISHPLWQGHFAAEPEIVGREVRLGGRPFTVIGVAPEDSGRRAILEIDAWVPAELAATSGFLGTTADLDDRGDRRFTVMGRLGEGRALDEVRAHVAVLGGGLHATYAEPWEDDHGTPRTFSALPARLAQLDPDRRPILAALGAFLFGATGLILLIACSNVASLFLARAHRRRRATAVRVALGAGRRRLVVSSLVESLLPALASAGLGVGLAHLAVRAVGAIPSPVAVPLKLGFQIDHRVLGFAVLLAVATSVVFGLAPALAGARLDLVPALKNDGSPGGRRGRLFGPRNLLVVAQVTASMVLLAGAALFLRSLSQATTMNFGIDPSRVAMMTKTVPEASAGSPEASTTYLRALTSRLAALPEVQDVQASRSVELTIVSPGDVPLSVAGHTPAEGESPRVATNAVTPGYLEMLGVPVIRGRGLRTGDGPGAPRVAVINQHFANRFWPGEEAIGQRFTAGEPAPGEPARDYEVVGVTQDIKVADIDDPPASYFWTSLYQDPAPRIALLVKGRASAEAMIPLLYSEVEVGDDEVTLVPPTALRQVVDIQLLPLKAASAILGSGGVFGLLLAVLGIYGIISFAVAQRSREIAIRVALGARQDQILRTIMSDGLVLTATGLGLGLAIVLPLARLVRSLLFGMSPLDPVALGGGAGLLLAAALLASFIPAQQATRIDPIGPLREE